MSTNATQLNTTQNFTFTHIFTRKDSQEKIFVDLDTLLNCREVCKDFQQIIDTHLAKITDIFFLHEKEIVRVQRSIKKREEAILTAAQPIIGKLKGHVEGKNRVMRNVEYYITPVLSSLWSRVSQGTQTNQALQANDSEEGQVNKFIEKLNSNKLSWSDCHALQYSSMGHALQLNESAEVETLKEAVSKKEQIQGASSLLDRRTQGLDLIFEIFGGREAFKKLPVLDISQMKSDRSSYIDFIPFSALTAPIMRGVDKFNRPFIVLRTESKKDSSIKGGQVFFQRYARDGQWSDARLLPERKNDKFFNPQPILDFSGYLIDANSQTGALVKHSTAFQALSDFIKNGGNDEYKLV